MDGKKTTDGRQERGPLSIRLRDSPGQLNFSPMVLNRPDTKDKRSLNYANNNKQIAAGTWGLPRASIYGGLFLARRGVIAVLASPLP